jgi:hypothetical protein
VEESDLAWNSHVALNLKGKPEATASEQQAVRLGSTRDPSESSFALTRRDAVDDVFGVAADSA